MRWLPLCALIALACNGGKDSGDTDTDTLEDVDNDGFDSSVDCNDLDATINPDATEVCNGVDDDCDELVDFDDDSLDTSTTESGYLDDDGDGYGAGELVEACELGTEYVDTSGDCDDANADVNPAATEVCNDIDDDCDTLVDFDDDSLDSTTTETGYVDADGDGFGTGELIEACELGTGYVDNDTDCDDTDADVNPDAQEVCNGYDDDCDTLVDLDDDSNDDDTVQTYYADDDADGFGNPASSVDSCSPPTGYVANADDCDDTDITINPDATEECDDVDNDCDGDIDDADSSLDTSTTSTWYDDADSDGYGDDGSSTDACDAPSGTVAVGGDCDDTEAAINPGETEVCDGLDNDCDTGTSEDGTVSFDDGSGPVDATSTFSGTSSSPATPTLSSAGSYWFCDGTYYANITVGADVDLIGFNGSGSTTLDGAGTGTIVDVSTTGVATWIEGLTLTNGIPTSSATGTTAGGAVACGGSGTTVDILDSIVTANGSSSFGGGVGAGNYCEMSLDSVDVTDNIASLAGGVWVYTGGVVTMVDSLVDGNTVTGDGGGFFNHGGVLDLTDTVFSNNTGRDSGGGGVQGYSTYGDTELICTKDSATSAGFVDNTATGTNAGALQLFGSGTRVESNGCDWGTSAGADDNSPDDIENTSSEAWSFGDDENFVCIDGDCDAFPEYDGTYGTAWETLATPTENLYSLMTYQPRDIPYIYNMYDVTGQYYDPSTDTWTDLTTSNPLGSLIWFSLAPYEGELWGIRGNNVVSYEPTTDTWTTEYTTTGLTDDRGMTESDEFGVAYGYAYDSTDGYIIEYDTLTGTYTKNATGLGSEYETRMAYDPGTRAIYFGSYSASNLYKWDIATGAVSTMASHPEATLNDVFCSDRSGHIYAAGGTSGTSIYQYDIATDTWAAITAMPSDHGNNGSCTVSADGYLYVGTGSRLTFHRLELY